MGAGLSARTVRSRLKNINFSENWKNTDHF